jgi:lambda repressor-like predicted transcriptional regulator
MAAVRKRGTTLQRLSREHGLARETLNKSLTNCFPRAHRIISELLGVPRSEIWPQWYDENDRRRSPQAARREALRAILERRTA